MICTKVSLTLQMQPHLIEDWYCLPPFGQLTGMCGYANSNLWLLTRAFIPTWSIHVLNCSEDLQATSTMESLAKISLSEQAQFLVLSHPKGSQYPWSASMTQQK